MHPRNVKVRRPYFETWLKERLFTFLMAWLLLWGQSVKPSLSVIIILSISISEPMEKIHKVFFYYYSFSVWFLFKKKFINRTNRGPPRVVGSVLQWWSGFSAVNFQEAGSLLLFILIFFFSKTVWTPHRVHWCRCSYIVTVNFTFLFSTFFHFINLQYKKFSSLQ